MSFLGDMGDIGDYGFLDDLGLSPEMVTAVPPLVGGLTALGTTYLLRKFVSDPTSFFRKHAPLLGAVASLAPAYAMLKKQGRGAAISTAAAGVVTGVGLWALGKLDAGYAGLGAYSVETPVPLLQGYEVESATPLLQGPPEVLSEQPEVISEAPELLSEAPQVMSGWSPAFV